ncbi:putative RDD family membrane protein YckC [Leifsonia sp. AK011]|uniref:RDD family protein n=1 Tax=Leifsonia sp. AK011 TaxID=2723075 RepID=UPI0015C7E099|nr:RDD family protein [Leifsonia sp. AK011]NYF11508.1 putative RDD family membrane protein YckC [Leifsonia sp. AK011]
MARATLSSDAALNTDAIAHDERPNELIIGEAVALDLRPTSFILRAAGAAIDFIAYFGGYLLLLWVLFSVADSLRLDDAMLTALSVVGLAAAIVGVPTAVETLTQGKSLGRLAVGARIVRDDGGAIGFRHALIRAFTGIFEIFGTLGGGAAIVALLNSRSRRLGDLVAGTYSQNERVAQEVRPVYGVPYQLHAWSLTADVARMPDALARRIAQFLSQAGALTPATRQRLALDLANEAAAYVSPLPASDPELFIAAVASVRRDRERAALEQEKRGLERLAPTLTGMPRGFPDRG